MAVVARAVAQAAAAVIRDETVVAANTAARVGGLLRDLADSVLFGSVVNADVAIGAAIAVAKLAPGAANTVLQSNGSANSFGQIVNAHVDAAAAIAGTKISPNFGAQAVVTTSTLSLDATPATSGSLRVGTSFALRARVGSDDKAVLVVDGAGNTVTLGAGTATPGLNTLNLEAVTTVAIRPGGVDRVSVSNSAVTVSAGQIAFATALTLPLIVQQRLGSAGTPTDLTLRAQGGALATNDNGGALRLQGGARAGTGLPGAVRLQLNQDDTNYHTMIEAAQLSGDRKIVSLCLTANVSNTQMPANTGDRVVYLANCAALPAANPVGGGILYASDGALLWRGPSGIITELAAG